MREKKRFFRLGFSSKNAKHLLMNGESHKISQYNIGGNMVDCCKDLI